VALAMETSHRRSS